MVDKRNGFWIRNYYYNENSKLMDNVNKEIVEFFKTVGFSLIEIKSSVFRIEESTLVFQTDHKDHTIDASTILYKDAEKILTQALQAQREAAVWEALLELEGEARLAIVEWENSADYDHTTNDGLYSFIRQISLKRQALTPPTK